MQWRKVCRVGFHPSQREPLVKSAQRIVHSLDPLQSFDAISINSGEAFVAICKIDITTVCVCVLATSRQLQNHRPKAGYAPQIAAQRVRGPPQIADPWILNASALTSNPGSSYQAAVATPLNRTAERNRNDADESGNDRALPRE